VKIIKRIVTLFISAALISLTHVGISAPALADGENQVATHIDWNGISLGTNAGISQSFTPLTVPSPSQGQVEWALHVGNSTATLSASIILLNTGTVVWQFMDVPLGSRVMGVDTSQCRLQSGNAFGTPNSARSICTTPLQAVAGETYNFIIKYWDNNGTNWWVALAVVESTGQIIQLGRLENNASKSVMATSMSMGGMNQTSFSKTPLPACSAVPNHSIIYSKISNSGKSQPTFSTFRNSTTCPKVANLDLSAAGKFKVNVGASTIAQRVPRVTSQVPHPAAISPGLIQNRYAGYFEDSTKLFDSVPESSITVESLPEYTAGGGTNIPFSNNWTGYIIPDYTGTWTFRMTSDDASYLYIGANAVINYSRDIHTALIDIGGVHTALTKTATVDLVKDQIYPFRVMYGDWGGGASVFKLEFKAPGFTDFQSDYKSLLWHTPIEVGCTNWGMDYIFSGDLGYEKVDLSSLPGCSRKYGQTNFTSVVKPTPTPTPRLPTKPTTPSFSLINIVGNKLNLSVNLGNAGNSRPDSIYLVAPKLGILDSNKLFGKISGSKASWSIDFDKLLSGAAIPLKVVGVKNGVESEPLEQDFNAPAVVDKLLTNKLVPVAPKNVKSRVVGTSAVITTESTIKAGALATSAHIFGTALGIPASQAILGEVIGTKVLFEIPLKTSMVGKTFLFTVYFSNEAGKSQPVQGKLNVPSAPQIPSGTIKLPTQTKAPKTVLCLKGSQTRAFAASNCPPGWKST